MQVNLRIDDRMTTQRGFTFIELLMALLMLTVLVTISAPSYESMITKQKLRATSSDIRSALMLTRSEAILTTESSTLQPKQSDWNNGWQVISGGNVAGDFAPNKHVHVEGPSKVRYSSWGRNTTGLGCQSFSIAYNGCAICIYLDVDGSSFVDNGECLDQCPIEPDQRNVWNKACD